jgi:hypothetical protein
VSAFFLFVVCFEVAQRLGLCRASQITVSQLQSSKFWNFVSSSHAQSKRQLLKLTTAVIRGCKNSSCSRRHLTQCEDATLQCSSKLVVGHLTRSFPSKIQCYLSIRKAKKLHVCVKLNANTLPYLRFSFSFSPSFLPRFYFFPACRDPPWSFFD